MKRLLLLVVITTVALFAFAGAAYANYGIHGGYLQDTDACAGCHRAHTAFADLTWLDSSLNSHNALLVSAATSMSQFCYTCHGNGAPGAATNVQGGVLDTQITGNLYAAAADVGDTLNGGGFQMVRYGETSASIVGGSHRMETNNTPMWGSDTSAPVNWPLLSCNSCHDVHGSSNYRILKDAVNGHTVGGYVGFDPLGESLANPDPNPWVWSAEVGYPNGTAGRDDGFRLHKQYPNYMPDYVQAVYARPPAGGVSGADVSPDTTRTGMAGWCIACHETYGARGAATDPNGMATPGPEDYTVTGGDDTGSKYRHKHPVNTLLSNFLGPRGLVANPYTWYAGWNTLYTSGDVSVPPVFVDLPLLHDVTTEEGRYGVAGGITYDGQSAGAASDAMDCLTCHRAHGSETTMTGFADSSSNASPAANTGVGGVPPTNDNAILRANNRGVCERCHNK